MLWIKKGAVVVVVAVAVVHAVVHDHGVVGGVSSFGKDWDLQ